MDGFLITNGNATGLTNDCSGGTQDGCGGGISVAYAYPIISNNIITNNVAALTTASSIEIDFGGGISLESADRTLIVGNSFISNTAGVAGNGDGGGMVVVGSSVGVQMRNNNFLNDYASHTDTYSAWGGGISVQYYVSATVQGNSFQGNHASGYRRKGEGRAFTACPRMSTF